MPIQLSEVVNDPDFAQAFTISRSQGGMMVKGVWQDLRVTALSYGVIQPATAEELDQVPEGDRVTGAMTFHSQQLIYETRTISQTDPMQGISDTIAWNGQNYRIVKVFPWIDFGYCKAIGVRMSGQ